MSDWAERSATVTGDLSDLRRVSFVTRVSWTFFVLRVRLSVFAGGCEMGDGLTDSML